ncbi:hypothetical protein [Mycolicibacterium septicum]|uniref:hypothetical protein n=1 Tax=Mycolicibacterium septicum TaxID=98668 RepID=UPI001AF16F39|nr:hypothetical protein [Mycolicibacterium septicum]QRY53384.1 hypothetical protein JVX95_08725 [Mycolicibacterium septicum]
MSDETIYVHNAYDYDAVRVARRGSRLALTLPIASSPDDMHLVGRIELRHERPGVINYLGLDRVTGRLCRGYVVNESSFTYPESEVAWRTVAALPLITEVFIGTEKDLVQEGTR